MEIKTEIVAAFYKFVTTMDGQPKSGQIENLRVENDENEPQYSVIVFNCNGAEEYMPLEAYQKIEKDGIESYLTSVLIDINNDISFCDGVYVLAEKHPTENSNRFVNMIDMSYKPMLNTMNSLKDYVDNKKWL